MRYGYVYQTNLLLENFLKISLKSFESFWFYIWVLVIWLLIVRQMVLSHMLSPCLWIKKRASKNHQMYSKSVRKICKKDVSSQLFFIFWSAFYFFFILISMVQIFLKNLWWQLLVPRSECLLVSSAALLSKKWNISTLKYFNLGQC